MVVKKKKQKPVFRHFQLKLRTKDQASTFDRFQKKVIIAGLNVTDLVMELIKSEDANRNINFTPLSEPDMLRLMIKNDVSRTRQSLKHMRDRGELVDPDTGQQLWGTDGATIIYNSEAVVKLLKKKSRSGRAGR